MLRTALAAAALGVLAAQADAPGERLDDFEDVSGWSVQTYPGTALALVPDTGHEGGGMRLDFDLGGGRGYVLARRPLERRLPANWAFSFALRGAAPPNTFEFKLVDRSGANVWWYRIPDWSFPLGWERVTVRKEQLRFAWGPAGGEDPQELGALEIAVTAGQGGRGSLWIDDLRLEERPPSDVTSLRPRASASSEAPGAEAGLAVDGEEDTAWRPADADPAAWLELDLGQRVEYGGLVVDWLEGGAPSDFRVLVSDDGESWSTRYEAHGAGGRRSYVPLRDGVSRRLRLELLAPVAGPAGVREVTLRPWTFSESQNALVATVAREAPRGHYPRSWIGEQIYWTVIGGNGDPREGLLSEDGQLEVDEGRFSVEPFLHVDGELVSWAQADPRQELRGGDLPIPSVVWRRGDLALRITAFAARRGGVPLLYARYRLANEGSASRRARLFLALRPLQVNPPWQSLFTTGGVAPVHALARDGNAVRIDEVERVESITPPDAWGSLAFAAGPLTEWLARGTVPEAEATADADGLAAGALAYDLDVAPGGSRDVWIAIPFRGVEPPRAPGETETEEDAAERLEETAAAWEQHLARIAIALPPPGDELVRVARSTVAYIFVNRDGPALQPGSRVYERSWIRDGALTSSALLQMGYADEVREFLRWYARYQFDDGRIPCCVDEHGPDPVVEHDSNGEFLFAVTEYWRYRRDRAFLEEMWPHVVKAVAYIAFLREQTLGHDGDLPVHGLAPPSISHEGYSSHPVHSYWDDFFLLRGLKDAVVIARELGDDVHAREFAALRDAFRADLLASLEAAARHHDIDYIPGSVELGDFDPTSTSIAVSPADELESLQPALARTFERYFAYFLERRSGAVEWQAYTPYELRNVGTLLRLGRKDLALEALDFFLADRRPRAWNAWAEVVWRDPRHPGFIGDMPHTWVGSGFLRSFRSMLLYERESDDTLVIGEGIPRAWVDTPQGVAVADLPTWYGPVGYTMRAVSPGVVRVRVEGRLHTPPARIRVASPYEEPLLAATVDGRAVDPVEPGGVSVERLPAEIELRYGDAAATGSPGP